MPHVTVGFQVAQHRQVRLLAPLTQVLELRKTCAVLSPAGAAQDVACRLVLPLVEGNNWSCKVPSDAEGNGMQLKTLLNRIRM